MSKKSESIRIRQFACSTYAGPDVWLDAVRKSAAHYCYICHDRDKSDTHYHVLLTFEHKKSFVQVRELLSQDSGRNSYAQAIRDVNDLLDYMVHEGKDNKASYDRSAIVMDDTTYWQTLVSDHQKSEDKAIENEAFLRDLVIAVHDRSHIKECAIRYGRDYMRYYKQYMSFAQQLMAVCDVSEYLVDYLDSPSVSQNDASQNDANET